MKSEILRIPKDRIGAVIGEEGATKERIERILGVRLDIKSSNQEIKISSEDPVNLLKAKNIILAISRGFSPKKALKLSREDTSLRIIDISDYSKSRRSIRRLKGRVIGRGGKARKTIENITNTYISIHGKTVSIIGKPKDILLAWKAVDMLLRGRKHQTVYQYLKRK